ncbi:DegT/DnrJ/EryC1/StrS family aminotransferase [Streptomyces sp. NPDC001262]|uniref:DegT/DnrJ/EryC1/StrS family aminotransferase n=1 Tax=unclassified Streptomyces TaxID=2593676 RepID=UPI0036CDD00A
MYAVELIGDGCGFLRQLPHASRVAGAGGSVGGGLDQQPPLRGQGRFPASQGGLVGGYGPKPLSAGEGGFVATDDTELYYRVLLHGQYNKRCRREIPNTHPLARFAVTGMGLKLRIHPFAAALAHAQLGRLDAYLAGRQHVAARMCAALDGVPGIRVPNLSTMARPSWYALPLRYDPAELGGLSLDRFLDALHAEGATETDVPGSTCPLHTHSLFQAPGALLPGYADREAPAADGFPAAEYVHATTLKLPVWHREDDVRLADAYTEAIAKVADHHKDLL